MFALPGQQTQKTVLSMLKSASAAGTVQTPAHPARYQWFLKFIRTATQNRSGYQCCIKALLRSKSQQEMIAAGLYPESWPPLSKNPIISWLRILSVKQDICFRKVIIL
jgi:hypothetical protein